MANSSQLSLPSVTARPGPGWLHHGGVKRRAVAGQHLRAGGGHEVAGDEDVLVRHRHAQPAAARRPRPARVGARAWASVTSSSMRQVGAQAGVVGRGPESAGPPPPPRPRARSWAASSASVKSCRAPLIRSPSAPGTAPLHGRGAALVGFALVGLAHHVFAQAQRHVLDGCDGVGQGLDAGGIHRRICSTMPKKPLMLVSMRSLSSGSVPAGPDWRCGRCLGGQCHGENLFAKPDVNAKFRPVADQLFTGDGVLSRLCASPAKTPVFA
jgi:hypothetical protein